MTMMSHSFLIQLFCLVYCAGSISLAVSSSRDNVDVAGNRHLSLTNDLLTGTFEIGEALPSGVYSRATSLVRDQIVQYHNLAQNQLVQLFEQFKTKYDKNYGEEIEERERRELFLHSLLMVLENNLLAVHGESSSILEINWYSDQTVEEMLERPGGNWPSTINPYYSAKKELTKDNSTIFDPYRTNHQVGPVQYQGDCASAVYFTAAATVESFWARKGHNLTELSVQQLSDCARDAEHGNFGCPDGRGKFPTTFNYIAKHGLTSMINYPYTGKDQKCDKTKENQPLVKINSWTLIKPLGDEDALREALEKHGPIGVAIAIDNGLMMYRSGIYGGKCFGPRGHAALLVGYGYDSKLSENYWILKNQWGAGWGEKGYFRIKRGVSLCDIAGEAFYVE